MNMLLKNVYAIKKLNSFFFNEYLIKDIHKTIAYIYIYIYIYIYVSK